MSSLLLWLGVGVLGAVGALARFLLDALIDAAAGARFPLGTLVVNLSGTIALGLLVGAALHGDALLLAGTALLGSYTTFSTWMLESHRLVEDDRRIWLALNVALSLLLGVLAADAGRLLAGG